MKQQIQYLTNYFQNAFKKPSREEVIENLITDRVNSLFEQDLSNKEIGYIVMREIEHTKERLRKRHEALLQTTAETMTAINNL